MYEIRCPNYVAIGDKWVMCNKLCCKAGSLSQIELVCRRCKAIFRAVVNEDGEVTYIEAAPEGFELTIN